MLDVAAILRPWWDRFRADHGDLELFDAHTHIGAADPDGARQTPSSCSPCSPRPARAASCSRCTSRTATRPPTIASSEAAAASGGRLTAFCRVDPRADAVTEARRCLDAGAKGIKLHPRAERFTLSEPGVREIVALAHERRMPVLIHAGRGIPALGRDTVRLSGEFTGARLILAHAAISDLAWLWRVLPEHPNLFIDTAWWDPADLIALFTLAPSANILWASDSPYGLPLMSAVLHLRLAVQAGVSPRALRSIAGAQLERILTGADSEPAGRPPRPSEPLDPLLERTVSHLNQAIGRSFDHGDPEEPVALARLACAVGEDGPHAEVFAAVLEVLDLYERHLAPPPPDMRFPEAIRLLLMATTIARTPDVPVPDRPQAPPPPRGTGRS